MENMTKSEALTLALKLAIQAPSESQARDCVHLAEQIAATMTPKQVEICKAAAQCAVQYDAEHAQ